MNKVSKKSLIFKFAFFTIFIGISIFTLIKLIPYAKLLASEAGRAEVKAYVDSIGFGGYFFILGIQVIQIVIAFLPGEPIEILAGIAYGTWGGLLTCILGCLIGASLVFALVKVIGYPIVAFFSKEKDLKEYSFFKNTQRLELFTFVLFLIPGTPKDVLTYIAGLTPINPLKFILISTFARIPSIITSTIAGENLGSGNFLLTALMFVLMGVIGAAGIVINNKLTAKFNKKAVVERN